MQYIPEHQYRCTIIRGKSQTDMEDLLPLYANMVHKLCPCKEDAFKSSSRRILSSALFSVDTYDLMSDANKKTIDNHLTEIAGTLLGLYYPNTNENGETFIFESESCNYLIENNDYPTFFKNLCLNFQFPNGAKWMQFVEEDIKNNLRIRPFCYIVSLLYYAQSLPKPVLLTKQEIGYYVLNNLDVLQGKIAPEVVYNRIIADRTNGIKRGKISGSREWQHIKEQFNLLELANIIDSDSTYLWLNKDEAQAISIFLKTPNILGFDCYAYPISTPEERKIYIEEWKHYYGKFNASLASLTTTFDHNIVIVDKTGQISQSGATKSSVDLGDEGEALIFRLEQERVRNYKERLVNKVLLLGKTKGLGYDISSIEAGENPEKPEFARYIEVKSTKRITEPNFNNAWSDSLNITSKEWVAAEQYGKYYNIYRVYFTKNKTIIVRINNPYAKFQNGDIEVYAINFQMNFGADVIEKPYLQYV